MDAFCVQHKKCNSTTAWPLNGIVDISQLLDTKSVQHDAEGKG